MTPPREEYWLRLLGNIVVAAGLFGAAAPLVAAVATGVFEPPADLAELLAGVIAFGVAVLLGAGFAAVVTCAVGLAVIPATFGVIRLLGYQPALDRLGGGCGAVTTALAATPIWLLLVDLNVRSMRDATLASLLYGFAITAVFFGTYAGTVAALSTHRRRARGRLLTAPFRLSVWRLLAVMVPISLALGLLRALDALRPNTAFAIALAAITCLVTYWPAQWLVNRWALHRVRSRRNARLAAGRST